MVGVLKNSEASIYQIASKTYEKVGVLAIDNRRTLTTKLKIFFHF